MTANIFHNIEVLLDCADSISRPIETNTLLTTFDFQYDSIMLAC